MLDDNDQIVSIQKAAFAAAGKEDEFKMGRVKLIIKSSGKAPLEESKLRVTLEFTGYAIDRAGVAVQDMTLLLVAPQANSKIDKVNAGNHSQSRDINGAAVTVSFGNLHNKETHKVIVDLILPSVSRRVAGRVLKITYTYRDNEGKLLVAIPAFTCATRTGSFLEKKGEEVNNPQAAQKINAAFSAPRSQDIKSPNNKKSQDSVALSGKDLDYKSYGPVEAPVTPSKYQISSPFALPPKPSDDQSPAPVAPSKKVSDYQSNAPVEVPPTPSEYQISSPFAFSPKPSDDQTSTPVAQPTKVSDYQGSAPVAPSRKASDYQGSAPVAPSRKASNYPGSAPVALSGKASDYQGSAPVAPSKKASANQIFSSVPLPPKASDYQSSATRGDTKDNAKQKKETAPIAFAVETSQDSQSSTTGGDTKKRSKNDPNKPRPKKQLIVDPKPSSGGHNNYKKLRIFSVISVLFVTLVIFSSTRESSVVNLSFLSLPNLLKHTLSKSLFSSPTIGTYLDQAKSSEKESKEPSPNSKDDFETKIVIDPLTPIVGDLSYSSEELQLQPCPVINTYLEQAKSFDEDLKEPPLTGTNDVNHKHVIDPRASVIQEVRYSTDKLNQFSSPPVDTCVEQEQAKSFDEELKLPAHTLEENVKQELVDSSLDSPTGDLGHYTHKLSLLLVVIVITSLVIYYSRRYSSVLNKFRAISNTPAYLEHATGGLNYYMNKLGLFFKFLMDIMKKFAIKSRGHAIGRLGYYKKLQLFSVVILIFAVIMCYSIRWNALLKMSFTVLPIAFLTFVTVVGLWKLVAAISLKLDSKNVLQSAESTKETRILMAKLRDTRWLSYYWKQLGLSSVIIMLILTLLIYYSIIWSAMVKILSTTLTVAFLMLVVIWFRKGDVRNLVMTINLKVFNKQNTLWSTKIIKQSVMADNKVPNNSPDVDHLSRVTGALSYYWEMWRSSLAILILSLVMYYSTRESSMLKMLFTALPMVIVTLIIIVWFKRQKVKNLMDEQGKSRDMQKNQQYLVLPADEASLDDQNLATGGETEEQILFPISEIEADKEPDRLFSKETNKLSSTAENNVKQELINFTFGGLHYYMEMLRSSVNPLGSILGGLSYYTEKLHSSVISLGPTFGGLSYYMEKLRSSVNPLSSAFGSLSYYTEMLRSSVNPVSSIFGGFNYYKEKLRSSVNPLGSIFGGLSYSIGKLRSAVNPLGSIFEGLSYCMEKFRSSFNFPAYFEQAVGTVKQKLIVNPFGLAMEGLSFYKEMLPLFSVIMLSILALIICYSIRWSAVFKLFFTALPIAFLTFFVVVKFGKYLMKART